MAVLITNAAVNNKTKVGSQSFYSVVYRMLPNSANKVQESVNWI
jgi:hypothetical protein